MANVISPTPDGITRSQYEQIVTASTAAFQFHHRLPTVQEIGKFCTISNRIITKCIATREFKDLMKSRGYDFSDRARLTPEQVWTVSIITDPTNRKPLKDKLSQAGITYFQYKAWLNQPLFARYVKEIGEKMLVDHISDVHTRVVERATNGDIQAMRLYYDLIGRTDSGTNKAVQDLNATVRLLLEVIMRNVTDTQTLARITSEIEQITSGKPAVSEFDMSQITIRGETIA